VARVGFGLESVVAAVVAGVADAGKLRCIDCSEAHCHYIAGEKQTAGEAGGELEGVSGGQS